MGLVPFQVLLQCEQFCIIYRNPLFPVPFPLPLPVPCIAWVCHKRYLRISDPETDFESYFVSYFDTRVRIVPGSLIQLHGGVFRNPCTKISFPSVVRINKRWWQNVNHVIHAPFTAIQTARCLFKGDTNLSCGWEFFSFRVFVFRFHYQIYRMPYVHVLNDMVVSFVSQFSWSFVNGK